MTSTIGQEAKYACEYLCTLRNIQIQFPENLDDLSLHTYNLKINPNTERFARYVICPKLPGISFLQWIIKVYISMIDDTTPCEIGYFVDRSRYIPKTHNDPIPGCFWTFLSHEHATNISQLVPRPEPLSPRPREAKK